LPEWALEEETMAILECRRVVFFSDGDEAAFFSFARSIPAVRSIKGRGTRFCFM
jgi:hypothetical protein